MPAGVSTSIILLHRATVRGLGQLARVLFVILGGAGEAGDQVFVGLAGGELFEPIGQPSGIGRAAQVEHVVVVDEERPAYSDRLVVSRVFSSEFNF